MLGSKTCAVVVPCFNEGASIAALVAAVRQHLPCVMVANDGSTDDTALLARDAGALLVIGNRMDNAHAMPWLRRRVNRWMSRKLSQRAGRQLPDTQSGFRLIHLRPWAALSLHTEHFEG